MFAAEPRRVFRCAFDLVAWKEYAAGTTRPALDVSLPVLPHENPSPVSLPFDPGGPNAIGRATASDSRGLNTTASVCNRGSLSAHLITDNRPDAKSPGRRSICCVAKFLMPHSKKFALSLV